MAASCRVAGESSESKIKRVREFLSEKKAQYLLLTSLEDIAWLLNMRGNDVESTPVYFKLSFIRTAGNNLVCTGGMSFRKDQDPSRDAGNKKCSVCTDL